MNNKSSLPTHLYARLISIHPDKQDIHFPHELNEDQTSAKWTMSQNSSGEIFIKNISASYLRVDDTLVEINQEKRLFGGERVSLNQDQNRPDYVFFLMDFNSDLKREREIMSLDLEKMTKLVKMEKDLPKELTCSICTNFLHKCMTLSPCLHTFCSFCLFDHLKLSSQCPLCRNEATSVAKNSVLLNVIQLVEDNFSIQERLQERKKLEEITFGGVIVRNSQGVYIGSYINGQKDGQGKMIYKSGAIYEGSWKNNKSEGKGTMIFKEGDFYDGFWMNDCYHGMGKYAWKSGKEYKGNWIEDTKSGIGTMKYEDGRIYQGNWKNDQREGNGMLTFPNGDKYEGKWVKNTLQPKVKIEYPNGDIYEGEINVENLQRQGKGVLTFKNGDRYDGNWADDKEHGKGRKISRGGTRIYEGVWKKGKISEEVTLTDDVNGTKEKAEWKIRKSGRSGKNKKK